jgi:hypothetical protein
MSPVKGNVMRWIIRLGILALAAVGAQRVYELLRPRVEEFRGQAGSRLHEVADTARVAADDVRSDLKVATEQVKDDLAPPADEAKTAVAETVKGTTGSGKVPSPS